MNNLVKKWKSISLRLWTPSRKKGRLIFERWGDNHIRNMIFNFLKIMNTLSRKIKIDFWEMRWQLWQKGENYFFKIMSTFSRKMKIHLWEMRWHYVKKIKTDFFKIMRIFSRMMKTSFWEMEWSTNDHFWSSMPSKKDEHWFLKDNANFMYLVNALLWISCAFCLIGKDIHHNSHFCIDSETSSI